MKPTNMKLMITAVILILSSCNKSFLDLTDPTAKDSDHFYQTEAQFEQAVNGVYSQLQEITNNQYIFAEMPSDNTTLHLNPSDRGQTDRAEAFEFWNVTATNVNIADYYDQTYNTLYNINSVLSKLATADIQEDKLNQLRGELLFLRGYHYFLLVQYFGDVVLLTEPLADASDAFALDRTPAERVYDQIIADLEEATKILPEKGEYSAGDEGRVTNGAALSLLGKVYLTTDAYSKAQGVLEEVLDMDYNLLPDYADVFDPTKKNHAESIFEVQYQGGNNLGEWSSFIYSFAPRDSEGAVTGFPTSRPGGWNIPTRSIIDAFEVGDKRKEVALAEGYTNADGAYVAIPFVNKYNHPHTIVGRTDDNWPVIRFAEVLLMLSEAINEVSGPEQAYPFINRVRERAGLPPIGGLSKESFREAVMNERRVELAFENHRWFDLKRSLDSEKLVQHLNTHGQQERDSPTVDRGGVPFSPADYRFEAHESVFPIPDRQLFLSDNMQQNPGY
ncbi:MAG: RagB/SusD family nutrient uptake outer membrane protein [Sphingobacterium sp.]